MHNSMPAWLLLLLLAGAIHAVPAQEADAQEDAPLPLVLQPPSDLSVCGAATFNHFTKRYRSCASLFFGRKDPDADCCEGLAAYYGMNATRPSRNCYCDQGVWEELISYEEWYTYYPFDQAFLVCARLGYIVPFYQENDGYCFGVPPTQEQLDDAIVDDHSPGIIPTAKDYISRLDKDHLVALSFATSIISGVGVLLLLWPLVWESAMHAKHTIRSMLQPGV